MNEMMVVTGETGTLNLVRQKMFRWRPPRCPSLADWLARSNGQPPARPVSLPQVTRSAS